jgi:hypothetical protein
VDYVGVHRNRGSVYGHGGRCASLDTAERESLPKSSGVAEIDILTRIGEGDENQGLVTPRKLVSDENLDDCSPWQLAKSLGKRIVGTVSVNGSPTGGLSLWWI